VCNLFVQQHQHKPAIEPLQVSLGFFHKSKLSVVKDYHPLSAVCILGACPHSILFSLCVFNKAVNNLGLIVSNNGMISQ
jgi:hypothetical protein